MSRILVLGEGATDRGTIEAIGKKLKIRVRFLQMRGNKPDKLKTFIEVESEYDKYIILKDLHQSSEEKIREKFNSIRKTLHADLRSKVKLSIAKRAIESWFLADLQALERALNCRIDTQIQNPEKVQYPDKKINELLKKSGKTYLKNERIAAKIVEELDLEKVTSKSVSFKSFLKNLCDP